MSPEIQVNCADAAIQGHLRSWLHDGRIVPPLPLRIDVRLDEVAKQQETPVVFRQPGVSLRLLPPDNRLSISWESAPAVAEMGPGDRSARVILSREAAKRIEESKRTFFLTVLIFLLRRGGWHHIHAGTALDLRGRGWLFAGDSGSGKSTTTALVGSRGWAVGTDDIAFLAPAGDRVEVHAFRSPIALRPGGHDLLARSGGVSLPDRGKVGYWPEELAGTWVPRVEPEIIVFTTVSGDRTRAELLSPGQALAELVRWSAWVIVEPALAQEHLELLTRLGRQSRAYRVFLGPDLFSHADLLSELIR